MNILVVIIVLIGAGLLAYLYYNCTRKETMKSVSPKKVRFDDNVKANRYRKQRSESEVDLFDMSVSPCSLHALNDSLESNTCLDDDLVDSATKKQFSRKLKQDHLDYLAADSAFCKYQTNSEAIIKKEPGADPFRYPEQYRGQTLDDIYDQQITRYEAV